MRRFLIRESSENSELGKLKSNVSHFLPTSPVSVATLDFSSASVPMDFRIAGTMLSLVIAPETMRPKLGMSTTELPLPFPFLSPIALSLNFLPPVKVIIAVSVRTLSAPASLSGLACSPSSLFLFYNIFRTCPLVSLLLSLTSIPNCPF